MELARKCSELISDVSDGDYLRPYICVLFSNGFMIHIFSNIYSVACAHLRLK